MKSNQKPAKIDFRISPETEKLLHEAGKSLDARLPGPKELTGKLGSLAADERDGFFLALLKKEGEKSLPLLESLMGQGEEIDLSIARTLGRWNSPLAADLLRRLASWALPVRCQASADPFFTYQPGGPRCSGTRAWCIALAPAARGF
jgi:hypothetical protein